MILSKLRVKLSTRRQRLDRMSVHYQDTLTAVMDRSWDDITANDSLPTNFAFANQHNWCSPMASETSESEEEDRDTSLLTLNLPQTPTATTMTLRENISEASPSTQPGEHGSQQYQIQQQQQEQRPAAALSTVAVALHQHAGHATQAQGSHPGQSTSKTSHLTNWLTNQSSIKRPPDTNATTTLLPCPPIPPHATPPGPEYTNPTPNKRRNTEMDLPCLEEDFDYHFPPLKSYRNRGDTTIDSNLLPTATGGKKEEQMEKAQMTKQKQPAEQQNLTPRHNDQLQQTLQKHQQHNQSQQAPTVFIPVVKDITSLLDKLRANPSVGEFTTKTLKGDGLRVVCDSRDTHAAVLSTLGESGIRLHTHQAPSDKGYRIFVRHLHRSTKVQWLSNQLGQMGFTMRFARVVKQRFSSNPLNLWELEIDPQKDAEHEKILQIQVIGHQRIKVERPYKTRDPVQCHRCQAFGHSKNYCRREFRCMKCGGTHPSTSCLKPRNHSSKCANCNGAHVSSYKGCPTFKSFRSKLRANSFRTTAQNNQKHLRRPREPQHKKTPLTPANANRFALLDSNPNCSSLQLRQRQQNPTPRQRQQQKHIQQHQQQQQRQHASRRKHLNHSQTAGNTSIPRNTSQSSRRMHRLLRQEKRQDQHQLLQQQRHVNPASNPGRNPAENHLANFQARLKDEQQQQLKLKHGQKRAPLPPQARRQIHFEPGTQPAQQQQQKRQIQTPSQRHTTQQPPQKSQLRHHNNPHNRHPPSTSFSEFFTRQAAHNQRLAASLEENNKNINGIFAQLGSLIEVLKHYMDRLDTANHATLNSPPPLSNRQQRHQLHQQKQHQQIGKETCMTNDDSDYNFHAIDEIAFTPANDSRHYE